MVRPKKQINWDLVERQMQAGCNAKEIARSISVDINTFYDRFKEEYGKGFADFADSFHSGGKGNIRLAQYMKALQGNVPMLILLGREWLGQGREEGVKESPFQELIDTQHENMILRAQMAKLKEEVNKNEGSTLL